ncbi:MAG: hydrogenase maturation protease [Cyanobacteria bacterium J06638_28]
MKTLVIGYGNTLRGDDGVGYRVAEAIEAWSLPDVEAIACHQLTPELAMEIAACDRVIFVDATLPNTQSSVTTRSLSLPATTTLDAHHSNPARLLQLATSLYDHRPTAYQVLIPTVTMEFDETLSEVAQAGMAQALEIIQTDCAA